MFEQLNSEQDVSKKLTPVSDFQDRVLISHINERLSDEDE